MKIWKKSFYVLLTLIEIIMIVAMFLVNYFTKTKMGMLRHIVHKNYLLEQQYPIQIIKYLSIIFLITIMILVLKIYFKRRNSIKNILIIMNFVMVLMIFLFIYFILVYSTYDIRAFYYISIMFFVATVLQIIKTWIGIIFYKK